LTQKINGIEFDNYNGGLLNQADVALDLIYYQSVTDPTVSTRVIVPTASQLYKNLTSPTDVQSGLLPYAKTIFWLVRDP